jgi:hypothetical protein
LVARPEVLVALLVHLLLLAEGVLRVLVRLVARRNHLLLELGCSSCGAFCVWSLVGGRRLSGLFRLVFLAAQGEAMTIWTSP